jgi:TonB family protein
MPKPSTRVIVCLAVLAVLVLLLTSAFFGGHSPSDDFARFPERLRTVSSRWNAERGNDRVYLHTDKPFYKPGETIWFGAYLRNADDLKPSRFSQVLHVELLNPKGGVEGRLELVAPRGVATGDFSLGADVPGGLYTLKAYSAWQRNFGRTLLFEKELTVQRSVLPRLKMELDFVRKAYGPGDRVEATLKLHSLENQPLAHHAVTFRVQVEGEETATGPARADAEGTVHLSFSLPAALRTPDALLNVLVPHEGHTESIARAVPVVLDRVALSFYPEGGDLVAGLPGRVAFAAVDAYGKPADVTGVVEDDRGNCVAALESYHQGMGAFALRPGRGRQYRVRLTKPTGISQTYALPASLPDGYGLAADLPGREALRVTVTAGEAGPVALVVQVRDKVYHTARVDARAGTTPVTIPLGAMPAGVARVTLFDGRGVARAERLAFVNGHKKMHLAITTDKEKYLPREKVILTIRATGEGGKPLPAQLSLAVADDKLLAFADDKSGHILAKMLLEPDLAGTVEEPNFYFDDREPKASQALDYLLMTRGWRHFTWREVLGGKLPPIAHRAERAVVTGRVLENVPGGVAIGATVRDVKGKRSVKTDSLGRFALAGLDLTQPALLEVTTPSYVQQLWVDDYGKEYTVEAEVSGRVLVAEDGLPVPGTNVYWKETTHGTTTDAEGRYRIAACTGCTTLVFSSEGFLSREVTVSRPGRVDVSLQPRAVPLYEYEAETEEYVAADTTGAAMSDVPPPPAPNSPWFEEESTVRFTPPEPVPDEEVVEVAPVLQHNLELSAVNEELYAENTVTGDPDAAPDLIMEEPLLLLKRAPAGDELAWQGEGIAREEEETLFQVVEQMPEFPGGMPALSRYLRDNLYYSHQGHRSRIEGTVFVGFVVDPNGKVSDVHVLKGLGYGLDGQAVRAIRTMPRWTSGRQNGRPVSVRYALPVRFVLNGSRVWYGAPAVASAQSRDEAPRTTRYYRARTFAAPVYGGKKAPEARADFRSTLFWQGDITLDATGKAEITFYNSDEITSFRAVAEGIGENGLVGHGEHTYYTQLPFSISARLPVALSAGDTLALPLTLKNNTGAPLSGTLHFALPAGWAALGRAPGAVTLGRGEARTLHVRYVVRNQPGRETLGVSFRSDNHTDAVREEVRILPRGFPAHRSYSGDALAATYTVDVNSPLPGTLKATLTAFPNTLSELTAGIASMLEEPHGCFEQTSSSTYPNVLVLNLLRETGGGPAAVRERAARYIEEGYKRLISFETPEGGFDWFGEAPGNEALTAYGLLEFTDMGRVYGGVDPQLLVRVKAWLLAKRDGKGGFRREAEGQYGFGRCDREIADGYIVYALLKAGVRDLAAEAAATHAHALRTKDPYLLALTALAHYELGDRAKAGKALAALLGTQAADGSWRGRTHSITQSGGEALALETTALAVQALLRDGQPDPAALDRGIRFLAAHRGYGGRFGSTQSTILTLQALAAYARYHRQTARPGTLACYVNGRLVAQQPYAADAREVICLPGLEKHLTAGPQRVEVRYLGTQTPLPYVLDLHWTTTFPQPAPACAVRLTTGLSKQRLRVGETVRLTADFVNETKDGLPMTMAVLGVPGGLGAQPWQLKALREAGLVDFYETRDNLVYLYFRQLPPGARKTIHLDLKAELPGTFEATASRAYLYYTDEVKSWSKPERVTVLP